MDARILHIFQEKKRYKEKYRRGGFLSEVSTSCHPSSCTTCYTSKGTWLTFQYYHRDGIFLYTPKTCFFLLSVRENLYI